LFVTELNDIQKELQQLARKVAREEIAVKAAEYDRTMEFPWDIVKKIWSLGILNPFVPESCGNANNTFQKFNWW